MTTTETVPQVPRVDPNQYEVLRPDDYHTYITSQEVLLEKYIRLLNPLIEKMAGSETQPGFDAVVFLDKSARPLSWMIKEFWPYMAPQRLDETTGKVQTAPLPSLKFANIDRLVWRKDPTKEMDEGGMLPVTDEDVRGLRSVFQVDTHSASQREKHGLDGKRILIVDEQSESGDTIRIAKKLFEQAFPTAEIDAAAWIWHPSSVGKNGERLSDVKEIPMWYPARDPDTGLHTKEEGRGVFGPTAYDPGRPAHGGRFPAESYKFLSTPPRIPKAGLSKTEELELAKLRRGLESASEGQERQRILKAIELVHTKTDPESLQLRKEIGQMAIDFNEGRLWPAITANRHEIKGMDPIDYNRRAATVRKQRAEY